MLNKISIRLRLTILNVILLTICCVVLTIILNFSANRMANVIEATVVTPAIQVEQDTDSANTELNTQFNPDTAANSTMPSASTRNSQAARQIFLYQSIFYMILLLVIGGFLTYYISGKALKPLHILSRQMRNCTVHNLSEDLMVPETHDEIADLTRSFNEMSNKLNDAFAMQKRFSQSAAHELRTPLTVLKTKVDVFKKKNDHTPEEYSKLLSIISAHTNRMSDLVKELLDLTNMDALVCDQRIEANELLINAAEELSPLAKEKNIYITVSGEAPILTGNKNLLHRAFYNVIENAVKYNVENGMVEITISTREGNTAITIKDHGIGIPIEMQPLIFEPFFRVDKSRSRKMGGAGLGLSIVKSIIEKHNGTISVSDHQGGGTIFEILLPYGNDQL
ncbi:sensor histidine kinase [Robinsoniella peoriensis]|uniref:sensor histidine kinase n=1 Tax=Robinsoniella peoriensis TaxID=180332 RepID=UPI00085C1639|nr:ATP-binding protein [Robinsoniella peoriensis]